jgi:hypothetical protein
MNYTKEEILGKAIVILKDLKGKYYFEGCVDGATYVENTLIDFGEFKNQKKSIWIFGVKALGGNEDLLIISDETGEPIYYQNFNTIVFDIKKDDKGYFRVGLPRD